MKVRVNYTIEADDDYRRAINLFFGRPGLASLVDVQNWLRNYGSSEDEDIMRDLEHARQRGEEP